MPKQAQTRIVLNDKYKELATELLATTGIESLSSLFSVLLTKYSSHLKSSWSLQLQPVSAQGDFISQVQVPPNQQLMTVESLPEVEAEIEPETDPFIIRIRELIENF